MKRIMTIDLMWDYLIEEEIATKAELQLITDINGYNEQSMLDVLYARTGCRTFEQFEDE